MMSKSDPFIAGKGANYVKHVDFEKLSKFANVFNRLNEKSKLKVLGMIEKDRLLAGYGASSATNINSILGEEDHQVDREKFI